MSNYIVIRASRRTHDQLAETACAEIAARDLATFRDALDERFPEGDAVGSTGALVERPVHEGDAVYVSPVVPVRPLVLYACMELAAPLGLVVEVPEQDLVADPVGRIDIDVCRVPTTAHSSIHDHDVRGRPHGVLPWVTETVLAHLVREVAVEGDRLELEDVAGHFLRIEAADGGLVVTEFSDDDPVVVASAPAKKKGRSRVARAAWKWATRVEGWDAKLSPVVDEAA